MSLLYIHINKKIQELRRDVESFGSIIDTAEPSNLKNSTSTLLVGSISTTLSTIKSSLEKYKSYVYDTSDTQKKETNIKKLSKLTNEYEQFKQRFEQLCERRGSIIKESERTNLFAQQNEDIIGKASGISDNPYSVDYRRKGNRGGAANGFSENNDTDTTGVLMDQQMKLDRSNAKLDEILEMGRQAFDDIVEQNETILKIKDKMSQGLSTLGVSRSTVDQIEKVMWEDKVIFYVAGFLTLLIMWLIWKYLG